MADDYKIQDGDLIIENGDFAIGESSQDDIELLLIAHKGEFREHPTVGAGASTLLKQREGTTKLVRELFIQLKNDSFHSISVKILNGKLNINATRDA